MPPVLVLPPVAAPELDQAFLPYDRWETLPAFPLVRIEDGAPPALATQLRVAWSPRGLHLQFACEDPAPVGREYGNGPWEEEEAVGVFLDPSGERFQYMAVLVSPFGRVLDARIENPHDRGSDSEVDLSWMCADIRARALARQHTWIAELVIPFSCMTPAVKTPAPGDRWVGNFFRIERQPHAEISAWLPTYRTPADLHVPERFGVLAFGPLAT